LVSAMICEEKLEPKKGVGPNAYPQHYSAKRIRSAYRISFQHRVTDAPPKLDPSWTKSVCVADGPGRYLLWLREELEAPVLDSV